MYSQLSVGFLVDVEAALKAKSLEGHIYGLDTNGRDGSQGQGTGRLVTRVVGNQVVNWLVRGIDWRSPTYYAYLRAVKGEAVDKQVLIPQLYDSPSLAGRGYWWGGTVDARVPGTYDYTLSINLGDVMTLDWTLTLDVQDGFTMGEPLDLPPMAAK